MTLKIPEFVPLSGAADEWARLALYFTRVSSEVSTSRHHSAPRAQQVGPAISENLMAIILENIILKLHLRICF